METFPLNQILYGPPGTGKTYNTKAYAVAIANGESLKSLLINDEEIRNKISASYEALEQEKRIVFCTFHQSMSYEDFVEGIKPELNGVNINYQVKDGILKRIAKQADIDFNVGYDLFLNEIKTSQKGSLEFKTERMDRDFKVTIDKTTGNLIIEHGETKTFNLDRMQIVNYLNSKNNFKHDNHLRVIAKKVKELSKEKIKPFILIIDEINRGNIAAIFGELITLLEDSKRIEATDETWATLTYSGGKFCLPSNLYIIGTMNTADRSVEALDTALRRRFSFVEMPPQPDLLSEDTKGINLKKLLTSLNVRISALKDKDHTIGHAWFMGCTTQAAILEVLVDKIIPLLREHFYNEDEKLKAVIGEQFFEKVDNAGIQFLSNIDGKNQIAGQRIHLLSRVEILKKYTNGQIDLTQLY